MKIAIALTIILFTACNVTQPLGGEKTLDFNSFSIETPATWTKIDLRGIDSKIGRIAIDETDTLEFDLGWYSNNLYEYDPTILDSSMIGSVDSIRIYKSEIIFVKKGTRVDPDRYRKNNVSWEIIDGRRAKIVYPRQSGIGTTGIYIDSLWQVGPSTDRFNLHGEDLKPENEKLVLQALRTLKFYKK